MARAAQQAQLDDIQSLKQELHGIISDLSKTAPNVDPVLMQRLSEEADNFGWSRGSSQPHGPTKLESSHDSKRSSNPPFSLRDAGQPASGGYHTSSYNSPSVHISRTGSIHISSKPPEATANGAQSGNRSNSYSASEQPKEDEQEEKEDAVGRRSDTAHAVLPGTNALNGSFFARSHSSRGSSGGPASYFSSNPSEGPTPPRLTQSTDVSISQTTRLQPHGLEQRDSKRESSARHEPFSAPRPGNNMNSSTDDIVRELRKQLARDQDRAVRLEDELAEANMQREAHVRDLQHRLQRAVDANKSVRAGENSIQKVSV